MSGGASNQLQWSAQPNAASTQHGAEKESVFVAMPIALHV